MARTRNRRPQWNKTGCRPPRCRCPPPLPRSQVPGASQHRLHRVDTTGHDALTHLSRHVVDKLRSTAVLSAEPRLGQLLRLRVAQINHCAYCLEPHHAAPAYAAALTFLADPEMSSSFEERHRDLPAHFDDRAILRIVRVVVNMNVWTRLKLAEGAAPGYIE